MELEIDTLKAFFDIQGFFVVRQFYFFLFTIYIKGGKPTVPSRITDFNTTDFQFLISAYKSLEHLRVAHLIFVKQNLEKLHGKKFQHFSDLL